MRAPSVVLSLCMHLKTATCRNLGFGNLRSLKNLGFGFGYRNNSTYIFCSLCIFVYLLLSWTVQRLVFVTYFSLVIYNVWPNCHCHTSIRSLDVDEGSRHGRHWLGLVLWHWWLARKKDLWPHSINPVSFYSGAGGGRGPEGNWLTWKTGP